MISYRHPRQDAQDNSSLHGLPLLESRSCQACTSSWKGRRYHIIPKAADAKLIIDLISTICNLSPISSHVNYQTKHYHAALFLSHLNHRPYFFQVEFEDHRIKDRKAWLEEGKAPYGQIPVLEVDGKIIAQTGAIAR